MPARPTPGEATPGAALHLVSRGSGPPLLLIHGTAADATTWTIQLASLGGFRLLAYDRRGAGRSPPIEAGAVHSIPDHAADAATLIERELGAPAWVCGSSFGGIIALELLRRRPDLLRGAVLCEPPLPSCDQLAAVPRELGCEFDRLCQTAGGPRAAEFFLRSVLTDAAYERIPRSWQQRACATFPQIRADMLAMSRYRVDYPALRQLPTPVLLLGGDRSPPFYLPTLEALQAALPAAELRILRGAGHMMHADAHRPFHQALHDFCT
jgi:pimeloyl-ACP methyl ester carboxylesterase